MRSRYLVPNAVTLCGMFCGFLSVIYATSGRFNKASLAIIIAIFIDGLDGRVARRLNATSKFGLEFDSLSDLVCFGVAPAILMYNWAFKVPADEFGVVCGFLYLLAAASRLARFNITEPNITGFQGLPTPGAAAMVAALVHMKFSMEPGSTMVVFGLVMMVVLAYLMVSNFEFFSIKRLKLSEITNKGIVALGVFIALLWYSSRVGLVVLAAAYCLSGPIMFIKKKRAERMMKAA